VRREDGPDRRELNFQRHFGKTKVAGGSIGGGQEGAVLDAALGLRLVECLIPMWFWRYITSSPEDPNN